MMSKEIKTINRNGIRFLNADYYNDCLKHLCRTKLEIKQKELMQQIALEGDLDKRRELSKELQKIILEIKGND